MRSSIEDHTEITEELTNKAGFSEKKSVSPEKVLETHFYYSEPVRGTTATEAVQNTIFDCEMGCFITVEEYERRLREKENDDLL